jgi:hypothetical protein
MKGLIFALGSAFPIVVVGVALYAAWMIHHGFSTRTSPEPVEIALAGTMIDMFISSGYKTLKKPLSATRTLLGGGRGPSGIRSGPRPGAE